MLAMKVRTGEILTLENGVGRDRTHVRVVRLGKKIESKNEVAIEFSSPLLASGALIFLLVIGRRGRTDPRVTRGQTEYDKTSRFSRVVTPTNRFSPLPLCPKRSGYIKLG